MKKVSLIALVLVAASLVFVGVAMANAGPHGNYTPITDACAGCHRAHTASGARLLVGGPTPSDFCLVCHGPDTQGADTDVISGVYANRNTNYDPQVQAGHPVTVNTVVSALLGGGFEYYQIQGQAISQTTTSRHDVDVTTRSWSNVPFTQAFGISQTGVMGDLNFTFECTSCHDPHGNVNYRILRTGIAAQPSSVVVSTTESSTEYTVENYGTGITDFCVQCHPAYHATAEGSGSSAFAGIGWSTNSVYRHRMDMVWNNNPGGSGFVNWTGAQNPETVGVWDGVFTYTLPLYDSDTPDTYVTCLTCHVAHGTSATMSGFASGGGFGVSFASNKATGAVNSFLLRLPNRGVCEVCHQK